MLLFSTCRARITRILVLVMLASWLLACCDGQSQQDNKNKASDTDQEPDTTPGPTYVLDAYPSELDSDVPIDVIFRLKLNGHLDVSTFSSDKLRLQSGPVTKWMMAYYEPVKREIVAWTSSDLLKNAVWELFLEDGIFDIQGKKITPVKVVTFTTGERVAGGLAFVAGDYASEVAPVFETHCVSCHGAGNPYATLNLSSATDVARGVVNVPSQQWQGWNRVEPYQPGQSYLMYKLLPNDFTSGARMPRTMDGTPSSPLTSAEQKAISDWIAGGAVF